MHVTGFGSTDVGMRRERNEDRHLVDEARGLYIVADGMGGHAHGDLAATIAVDTVSRTVTRFLSAADVQEQGVVSGDVLEFIVREAVSAASREVYRVGTAASDAQGMGCTLTVLLVSNGIAAMAHVGDSRLYRLRSGEARQLSKDHTLVAELIRAGAITPAEGVGHSCSHVLTRAIGTNATVDVDTVILDLRLGDRYLICSDGLSNALDDEGWFTGALGGDSLVNIVERLIKHANDAGGDDNITAVVVEVQQGSRETLHETQRHPGPLSLDESSSERTPFL